MWQISLGLSEVLSDIGVTDSIVQKRRRAFILMETVDTVTRRFEGRDVINYNFGSQSEGSTTVDLNSDIDTLFGYRDFNVIQNWSEWKNGEVNVKMVKDETTSPGYCLLQFLCPDTRLLPSERHIFVDGKGRVLLKNTYFDDNRKYHARNGPAILLKGNPQTNDEDYVMALFCKSWPMEAQSWLVRQCIGKWPTEEMKRYCETTGCFVVPVSSKSGQNEETEWRISTSKAERCLMFSLNITQMRCYILMKMILKTFIHPKCDGVITSFMCKTVLFHCIQNTSGKWQENNLLEWLNRCLLVLLYFVYQDNCPHFIIPVNNLLKGKLSQPVKRQIIKILQSLIQSNGRFLFEIVSDNLRIRLLKKLSILPFTEQEKVKPPSLIQSSISVKLLRHFAAQIGISHVILLREIANSGNEIAHSKFFVFTLAGGLIAGSLNEYEKTGCIFLIPFLCSTLGSALASHDLDINKNISQDAMGWFSAGLNSDVSSGKLKFASALYCSGDMDRTESVLKDVIQTYDKNTVKTVCICRDNQVKSLHNGCIEKSNKGTEELIRVITSFCVKFIRCEMRCVPRELQYEMFGSSQDKRPDSDKMADFWTDSAAVDSLPFVYFLQYKTYGRLQKIDEQARALAELINVTTSDTELCLGHSETALNLLGQCMEQENRYDYALNCYERSLNIKERNNAAKFHLRRLEHNKNHSTLSN